MFNLKNWERNKMKYCQGPNCHTYRTKDRLRGPKGAKHYQTRRRSTFYNLRGNACSMQCERDWFNQHGEQAINHFGRTTEPKVLTQVNAWTVRRDYNWDDRQQDTFFVYNWVTEERRPITQAQYENNTATTDDGRLNI